MKYILYLFIVTIIVFTSCEGRKTSHEALLESIEKYDKEVTVEKSLYIPEFYSEREVDTLISNGFRVKIKTYSDMNNSVVFTKIKDTINYRTHYRNFKFDILVKKDGKIVYQESFDKEKVNKEFGYKSDLDSNSLIYKFNELAILKSVQLETDNYSNDAINISIAYAIPNRDFIDWHKFRIDKKGKREFILQCN
jgi:hypothetical protein